MHIFPHAIHIEFPLFGLINPPAMQYGLVDKKLFSKFDYKVGKSVILWEYRLINALNT